MNDSIVSACNPTQALNTATSALLNTGALLCVVQYAIKHGMEDELCVPELIDIAIDFTGWHAQQVSNVTERLASTEANDSPCHKRTPGQSSQGKGDA